MSKKRAHILVVDDDPGIVNSLRRSLEQNDYEVLTARSGEEALTLLAEHHIDLMLLDLKFPTGMSGMKVCEIVAQTEPVTPILILSVRNEEDDKVEALNLGADDYVAKPFSMPEVLARITALLRRTAPTGDIFISGPLHVDFSQQIVLLDGKEVDLTPIEFEILKVLIANRKKITTKQMLLDKIWKGDYGFTDHHLYVYIHSLRKKIEPDIDHPRFIQTEHRIGYRFKTDE